MGKNETTNKVGAKLELSRKLSTILEEYKKALVIKCDNLRSKQFQFIRRAIREESIILMGKNTRIKRYVRAYLDEHKEHTKTWDSIIDHLAGNVGILFTKGELAKVYKEISKYKPITTENRNDLSSVHTTKLIENTEFETINQSNELTIKVFDNGMVYDPRILELKDEDFEAKTLTAIRKIASISLVLSVPTSPAIPYKVLTGYKKVLSIAIAINYGIKIV